MLGVDDAVLTAVGAIKGRQIKAIEQPHGKVGIKVIVGIYKRFRGCLDTLSGGWTASIGELVDHRRPRRIDYIVTMRPEAEPRACVLSIPPLVKEI
jgi:hypothetical protein